MKSCSIHMLLVLAILVRFSANAQTTLIDGLKKEYALAQTKEQREQALLKLCDQRSSLPTDTLLAYYKELKKSISPNNTSRLLEADFSNVFFLYKKGHFDSSMKMLEENLPLIDREHDFSLYGKYKSLKSNFLVRKSQYTAALHEFYDLLKQAEVKRDTFLTIVGRNGIGWVHMEMNQYREALDWFHKSIATSQNPEMYRRAIYPFSNMAAVYNSIHRNDSAEIYILQAIRYSQEAQNQTTLANALNIYADILIDTKRTKQAGELLEQALAIRKDIADPFLIVSDMQQLALFYASNHQSDKGIALCQEGIRMAEQFSLTSKLPILYEALAENYQAAGNSQRYGETLKKLMVLKDSLYGINSAQAIADIQTKYELQKNETLIVQQQFDITRKNYLVYGMVGLFVLTGIFSLLLFRNYRRAERLKLEQLMREEWQLKKKQITEAEEKERKRIAADLHDNMGAYAAAIASNVDQLMLQPSAAPDALQQLNNNAQAIVAQLSDTIWILKKESLSLTAISDRLKMFMMKLQPSYPQIQMDVVESLEREVVLSPTQGLHLFQILQEAVNNALRHSKGGQIQIRFSSYDNWQIVVDDDGIGLTGTTANKGNGFGIDNMQARAQEAGFGIQWSSLPDGGTRVTVEPHLPTFKTPTA